MTREPKSGVVNGHKVEVVRTYKDSHRPNIRWARVRAVDGTKPFLRYGEYERETNIRIEMLKEVVYD